MGIDWNVESRRRLKVELARKEIGTSDLVARLRAIGVAESEENIRAKVKRGMFPFSFFLQCMAAIETSKVSVKVEIPEKAAQASCDVACSQCSTTAAAAAVATQVGASQDDAA